ncbi:hypothetical protein BDV93DRAFT_397020, partial [Ceratobasidium sp. AG-I]
IIVGGIVSFMQVAATFQGNYSCAQRFQVAVPGHAAQVFVRRGGLGYQEGSEVMCLLGKSLGVPIRTYGLETHITEIVPLAL